MSTMHGMSVVEFQQSVRDGSIFEKLPSYEGKDPFLEDEPVCATCFRGPTTTRLLCCSRCHTAWYCNSRCQKADYPLHKEICVSIAQNLKRVEQRAVPLRNMRVRVLSENFFETQVGTFGRDPETSAYMEARGELAENYMRAAYVADIKAVWDTAIFHILELLRLDATGPMNWLDLLPFMLLNVHRDDDTYTFIRYWMRIKVAREVNMIEAMRRHILSKEGDWIYPRAKNCRFLDIFDEFPNVNYRDVPLSFLVALLIIKCRIVATYDATCRSIDLAFGATGGQRIHVVQHLVKEMLIDEGFMNIESQRQQVDRLVNVIHRNNPSMLPAILNPTPLLRKEYPQPRVEGEPSEASYVLTGSLRCFLRVPGAKEMLVQRFGENPTYNI